MRQLLINFEEKRVATRHLKVNVSDAKSLNSSDIPTRIVHLFIHSSEKIFEHFKKLVANYDDIEELADALCEEVEHFTGARNSHQRNDLSADLTLFALMLVDWYTLARQLKKESKIA